MSQFSDKNRRDPGDRHEKLLGDEYRIDPQIEGAILVNSTWLTMKQILLIRDRTNA